MIRIELKVIRLNQMQVTNKVSLISGDQLSKQF